MQRGVERQTLQDGRYCPDLILGTGTYGYVLRCHDNVTGRKVAIKVAHREAAYRRAALNERNVLNQLKPEPSVVRLLDSFEENGRIHIVTEILYKNLYEIMRDQKFVTVPLDIVRDVARVVLSALQKLHATGHIHCDIKPENVMLRSPKSFHDCCVIDFGAVRTCTENQYYDIQSLWYRAPEVICGVPYTVAIDVWSVGCLLYELHTGNPLFQGNDPQEQLSLIIQLMGVPSQKAMCSGYNGKLRFTAPNSSPRPRLEDSVIGDPTTVEMFCDLLYQLLVPDESQRYTVAEALNHPFITGLHWTGPTSMRMNFNAKSEEFSFDNGLSSTTSTPEWKRNQQFYDEEEESNFAVATETALAGTELPRSLHQAFGPPSIDDWNWN